jgi:hypothetical protein
MGNQNTTDAATVPRSRSNQTDQQIRFDAEENLGWPQPTTRKKSDLA